MIRGMYACHFQITHHNDKYGQIDPQARIELLQTLSPAGSFDTLHKGMRMDIYLSKYSAVSIPFDFTFTRKKKVNLFHIFIVFQQQK